MKNVKRKVCTFFNVQNKSHDFSDELLQDNGNKKCLKCWKSYLNSVNPADIHVTVRDYKRLNWFVIERHSKRVQKTNKKGHNTPKKPHFLRGVKDSLNIPRTSLLLFRFARDCDVTFKSYGCL